MKKVFLLLSFIYSRGTTRHGDREKGDFVCARARHKAWSMVTDFSLLYLRLGIFYFIFYSYINSGD